MACSLRLAEAGHRVQIFEAADSVGGKLGLFERDGFRFDTGPSLLTMPHLLREVVGDDVTMRRLDPVARYRFGDGTWWNAPDGEDSMAAAVERLRPGNGAQWARFWARAQRIWDVSHESFLESPRVDALTLLRQALHIGDLQTMAPWRSLHSLAAQHLTDPRLVTFVDRYATYAGSDPRKAPAALAAIVFAERHFGAWYVDGGLRRIAEVLVERLAQFHVPVHLNATVTGIDCVNGEARGVEVDGRIVAADVVVANADASQVYGRLVDAPRALRQLRRAKPSLSGFVLCLAVDGPRTEDLAHHTVLFPERYEDEFDDLFGPAPRPVREPAIYLSVPDDPAVAPPGSQAWFVLVNAPRHEPDGGLDWGAPGLADSYADRVLAQMAERGVEVRPQVRWREIRTPADLARRTGSPGGSIYGTSSNGPMAAFLRPANRSPVAGLFLVGGSSHPGGGLPLVLLSARIVAGLVGPA